jgi:hypothetical protein
LALLAFAGAFSVVAGAVADAAGAFSSANATPRVRANAIAVKRATIFFIGIHPLSDSVLTYTLLIVVNLVN